MLIYQYAVYLLTEWDQRNRGNGKWNFGIRASQLQAIGLIAIVEMLGVLEMLYLYVIISTKVGSPVHKSNLSGIAIIPCLAVVYCVLWYVNYTMLGKKDEAKYYKQKFDGLNKHKKMLWELCVIVIGFGIVASSMFLLTEAKAMLVP